MNKTLKIGMLAAAAVLMVLTGCKNGFTAPSPDSFKLNADEHRTTGENPLMVTLVSGAFSIVDDGKYGNSEYHQIKITFSEAVKLDAGAVTFSKATNKGADKAPELETITGASLSQVDGTDVYFKVPTKDVTYLYVYVHAAKVKTLGGAVMNQDGDSVWEEPVQDDAAVVLKLDRLAPDLANADWLSQGAKNKAYGNRFGFSTKTVGAEGKQNADMTAAILISLTTASSPVDPADDGFDPDDITKVLRDHLKVEQFNPETKAYESVTVTGVTYEKGDKQWVAVLSGLKANRQLLVKWENRKNIPALKSTKYTFETVFSTNSDQGNVSVADRTLDTGSVADYHLWGNKGYTFAADESDTVTFTLKPKYTVNSNTSPVSFVVWREDDLRTVTMLDNKGNYHSFKGFDTDTLKPDHFKVFVSTRGSFNHSVEVEKIGSTSTPPETVDFGSWTGHATGIPVSIKELAVRSSDVDAYPNANNEITLRLNERLNESLKLALKSWLFTQEHKEKYSKENKLEESYFKAAMEKDNTYTGNPSWGSYKDYLKEKKKAEYDRIYRQIWADVDYQFEAYLKTLNFFSSSSSNIECTLYVSPEVKTAACTGYYDGNKEDAIPSLGFSVPTASDDPYEREGWLKLVK